MTQDTTSTSNQTAPPAGATERTWTVYEQVEVTTDTHLEAGFDVGTVLLVQVDAAVVARTGAEACWALAEGALLERAESAAPPVLLASRNGTAQGLTEARPYAVERVARRKS